MGLFDTLLDWGSSFGGSRLDPTTWPGRVGSRFEKDLQPGGLFGPSKDQAKTRDMQRQQAEAASRFAGVGERGYGAMTDEAAQSRDYLRRLASGQESVSQEQLRQGLQQQQAAQRSMAASASPSNSAMAARTAAIQMGRAGTAMAGNAALAGIQERQAAQQALANMIMQQRGQDMQVALGSRQNANAALGAYKPEPGTMEKVSSFLPVLPMLAKLSDKRHKTDIEDGEAEARRAMEGLRAFTYRYKDERHGKGKQLGILAQDLERAGLKHAVEDTPDGKRVKAAELATSLAAMMPGINRRLSKLERADEERRRGSDEGDGDELQRAREGLRAFLAKSKARAA